MSNIKKIIKKILPDKLIYDYRIIQILPQYIRSKHKAAKISIPEFKMMSDEETVDCIINKNMFDFHPRTLLYHKNNLP